MEQQKCKECCFFSAYYEQKSDCYMRQTNGYCSKFRAVKSQYENCDEFTSNEKREKSRENRRLYALDRALKAVHEIAEIMKDKDANDKLQKK